MKIIDNNYIVDQIEDRLPSSYVKHVVDRYTYNLVTILKRCIVDIDLGHFCFILRKKSYPYKDYRKILKFFTMKEVIPPHLTQEYYEEKYNNPTD